jgi:hypothetical protein
MGSPVIFFGNAVRFLKSALVIPGGTSGSLTVQPAAVTTSHTLTFPAANASGALTNNGSGALSWTPGASTVNGMVSNNDSAGNVTVLTGTSLFNPYLNVLSPDVYTVQTGAQLISVGTLNVEGTLTFSGTAKIVLLPA